METFAYFSSASQTQNTLDGGLSVRMHLDMQAGLAKPQIT